MPLTAAKLRCSLRIRPAVSVEPIAPSLLLAVIARDFSPEATPSPCPSKSELLSISFDIINKYHFGVNSKHLKTLQLIFQQPTTKSLKFSDIEALVVALGGEVQQAGVSP